MPTIAGWEVDCMFARCIETLMAVRDFHILD